MMSRDLSDREIREARGIGPQRAGLFERLGIRTVRDSLYYLPFRYEDRRKINPISSARREERQTVRGRVISAGARRLRGKSSIFELLVSDGTGTVLAKWFNQPFLRRVFRPGHDVFLTGTFRQKDLSGSVFELDNPEYECVDGEEDAFVHTGRIVPYYRLTDGIGQKLMRKIMYGVVTSSAVELEDPIPEEIALRNDLPPLQESLFQLHFPDSEISLDSLNTGVSRYHRRLAFEEFFLFEAGMASLKEQTSRERGIAFTPKGELMRKLLSSLPFELTSAQRRVAGEIQRDMISPSPMRRLLQGDVGSGKTVIALSAVLNAVECGYQAAVMAPTELLAEQHHANISAIVGGMGLEPVLLTKGGQMRPLKDIASGKLPIVIGTHALIQDSVKFGNLGLAVIDEQHKFGVAQRSMLRGKGKHPDLLVMTATPIPRSLALTLYGDLDISVIDELPPKRKPVATTVVDSSQKPFIYGMIESEISRGRQAYVVYPAIEESEKTDLRSALQGRDGFRRVFPGYRTDLIHGRMKRAERESVMASFKRGELDILVSTTVIEVGLDVPNATIMIIIHAERFGLAQLHQLRGRVGRGGEKSSCVLVAYKPAGPEARRRLESMVRNNDGFRVAEEDLAIRGPGDFFGTRQSGMPELKVADIIRDAELLEAARTEAFDLLKASRGLTDFPMLKKAVDRFWKEKSPFIKTGEHD